MSTKTKIFDSFVDWETGNQLLEKINLIMTEMNTSEFQVMSAAEEVAYIIDDVFDGDIELKNSCIESLCESHGIAYCDENMDEINDLIIENEDELYSMIQNQETAIAV